MDALHEDLHVILRVSLAWPVIYRSHKFFEQKLQKQMKNILYGINLYRNYYDFEIIKQLLVVGTFK
jgi:hypothetical protein